MSIHAAVQGTFDFFPGRDLTFEVSDAPLSSDAGLLAFRQFDQQLGWTEGFAAQLHDTRDPALVEHSLLDMVRARVYGILAGYEDQNDHDTLRSDPIFKLLANRSPDGPDLASQPTLSRFENAIDIPSLQRLRGYFVDQFIASFAATPLHLTIDIDAVDDPAHGEQQLVLFHGYFEQTQYFPYFFTCADNDQLALLQLRHGTAHATLGVDDDLEYLVARLRHVWPDVHLHIRADSAYGIPVMFDVCERLGLDYTFGIAGNPALKRKSDDLLQEAEERYRHTGEPQRLFTGFWHQAQPWDRSRFIIAKAECHARGTNRRFVVTNRPGAPFWPELAYDDYAARGESENRNKEIKCGLAIDRTSDHRFVANFFRLYLHALAMNLLVQLRRRIVDPLPSPVPEIPVEALEGTARQKYFRCRRRRDPLGEGQPCTWRTLLIKVAAEVIVSTRRIVVRLSSSWPNLDFFQAVCAKISPPLPPVIPSD